MIVLLYFILFLLQNEDRKVRTHEHGHCRCVQFWSSHREIARIIKYRHITGQRKKWLFIGKVVLVIIVLSCVLPEFILSNTLYRYIDIYTSYICCCYNIGMELQCCCCCCCSGFFLSYPMHVRTSHTHTHTPWPYPYLYVMCFCSPGVNSIHTHFFGMFLIRVFDQLAK